MPVLDASHDFAHDVEGDSAWSESYYFNAYDPAVDTWAGRVTLDGESRGLDPATARGNRDKSWGLRRWGGPQMRRWFSINMHQLDDDGRPLVPIE